MKPILFIERKVPSILMLFISLLISITLGVYKFGFDNSPKVTQEYVPGI
jgi:hypothetical protein